MEQRDIKIADGDAANPLTNPNKPINLYDTEFQTYDECSQDLFDDSESSAQNSPCVNFDVSPLVRINSPRIADLTALTQTPKIGKEDSSPCGPTVPTIPRSLVPFISTVNESWNSELETPQAKTTAEINLRYIERREQLSKSCETMERKRCDSMRSNGVIPDITTPSGCFVAGVENEGHSTSPILNTMIKRRRPKRRILKSLIDTTVPADSSKEITEEIENLEAKGTLPESDDSPINNTTFVVDENCLPHNSNINFIQDEINNAEIIHPTEPESMVDNVLASTLIDNPEEEYLMNERLQNCEDFREISQNEMLENEERILGSLESANKMISDSANTENSENDADEKSLKELVKEIRELEEKKERVSEYRFADIPMDVFTRDAKALEHAELVPIKPADKSNIKKQWGLISFTEMCLLEQENCKTEDLGVKETERTDSTIKNLEFSHNLQEDKLSTAKSDALSIKEDGDIFSSSFTEKDEPALDIDEFSPWFYPSNEMKSEFLNNANTVANLTKDNRKSVKTGSDIATSQKSAINKNGKTASEYNEIINYPLRFTTAREKVITCVEKNPKNGENSHHKTSSKETASDNYQVNNNDKLSTNSGQLYSSIGFSTASGKPITISKDKITKAAKLYDEIALQDGIHGDAKMLRDETGDHRTNNKENEATILNNSYCSIGFATADGRPIKISEDKIKKSTKLYDEIALQDGMHYNAKMLCDKMEDHLTSGKGNKATILQNPYSSMGFSTARGKPIKISEDKLKEAAKIYNEINLTDNLELPVDSLKVPMSRGIKRRREYEEIDSHQTCEADTPIGFKTACGKPVIVSKMAMKKAKMIYEGIDTLDTLQSQFPQDKNLTKELMNSVIMGKNKSNIKNYNDTLKTDIKSIFPSSFGTTSARHLEIKESITKNTKTTSDNEDSYKLQRLTSAACGKTSIISDIEQTEQLALENLSKATPLDNLPNEQQQTGNVRSQTSKTFARPKNSLTKHHSIDHTVSTGIFNPTASISSGFSTASGKAIQISNQALLNARNLLDEDVNSCESRLLICKPGNRDSLAESSIGNGELVKISDQSSSNVVILSTEEESSYKSSPLNSIAGFSTANCKLIKISDDAMAKAKKLFDTEEEDTPPPKSSLKRNSAAMETHHSVSKTPALKSAPENILSKDTPVGVSAFQTSKRVRFNSDLQARKLFSETGGDTDEETEDPDKFQRVFDKNSGTLPSSSNNYAHNLLIRERNKNISFIQNSAAGLYTKSEMFEVNDRLMVPKLEAQKSWPLNQDTDTTQLAQKFNNENVRLAPVQRARGISTYCEEITASTEALLADEENSFDGKSWAATITCSPSLVEDRDISVKPITVGMDCVDILQEIPTSPIIGAKFHSRKKNKRNKRNVLKKDMAKLKTGKVLEEQIVSQGSQQSSGAATPSSDSSKESQRTMSTVIQTMLVSKLERLEETSARVQPFDNQFENSVELTPSEIKEEEEGIDSFLENRIVATLEQEKEIRAKKKREPKPILGSLFLRKMENRESRISWRQATNGVPPTSRTANELMNLGIGLDVLEVTAATALCYRFRCFDFYSKDEIRANAHGLETGDGGRLIFNENGYAGAAEFGRAFMASPGVDPTLVSQRWVENHYRWIVWKLASMDRMKFRDFHMPRMLTPRHVMEQLKYRYDREIDKSERPALRRIIEKDDPPSKRMVLCVATITKLENVQVSEKSPRMTTSSHWKVELTDGWYSITATIDSAMSHLIAFGKVREGTKLITCRAELLNCDQGYFPLEIPGEASLKIHTNSTRRSRWDTKLGYCKSASPIPTALSSILPNGGLIGKLSTIIARVYPIQYFEKTWSGQSVFRNNKCEDKAAMMYEKERQTQIDKIYAQARADFETRNRKNSKTYQQTGGKLCDDGDADSYQQSYHDRSEEAFRNEVETILRRNLPPPRKVTLVLKVRVMEGDNLAILTVWAPGEDIIDVLKEGNRVSIHNVQTSGKRSGELQLTAGCQSFVKHEESNISSFPGRCLTSLPEISVAGFNPAFGEFDTVGMVVSLGPAPHGMKNFEVVNLAYPNPDPSDSAYLSILFWEGIAAHGFSDVLSVGEIVACTNLQWRRGAPRTIPIAYSTEHSTFTRNPRQIYLRSAFDSVKSQITNPATYASQCAAEIAIEHQKKSAILRSPAVQGTPIKASPSAASLQDKFSSRMSPQTPQGLVNPEGNTPVKYSIQRRLEKLQWYGEAPDLSPITLNHSSMNVNQKFVSLVRTPEKLDCVSKRSELNVKK